MDEITIDDFFKVDLRIAKVVEVSEIEEADKLVQLKLDLGDLGECHQGGMAFEGIQTEEHRQPHPGSHIPEEGELEGMGDTGPDFLCKAWTGL